MAEYIEREATVKLLRSLGSRDYRREKGTIQEAIKMVSFQEYTPSADVAQVRHGHWETNSDRPDSLICSVCKCGFDMWKHDPHNYCPNCGAKMARQPTMTSSKHGTGELNEHLTQTRTLPSK